MSTRNASPDQTANVVAEIAEMLKCSPCMVLTKFL